MLRADRGSEFANSGIDDLLEAFDVRRSLSRKGDPCDNAVIEPANRILKKELVSSIGGRSPTSAGSAASSTHAFGGAAGRGCVRRGVA